MVGVISLVQRFATLLFLDGIVRIFLEASLLLLLRFQQCKFGLFALLLQSGDSASRPRESSQEFVSTTLQVYAAICLNNASPLADGNQIEFGFHLRHTERVDLGILFSKIYKHVVHRLDGLHFLLVCVRSGCVACGIPHAKDKNKSTNNDRTKKQKTESQGNSVLFFFV